MIYTSTLQIFLDRYTVTEVGKTCRSQQQEIDSVTDTECKMAGGGFGARWKNETGKHRWTGPGTFSACLVTSDANKSVQLNPEPFRQYNQKTNLNYSAICRASGNIIARTMYMR